MSMSDICGMFDLMVHPMSNSLGDKLHQDKGLDL